MQFYIGTSGYSYKEWKGLFYPKNLRDKGMLRFYGKNPPAVEINNTFYRMPTATMLEGWAEQAPADFQFILKASRKITHSKPLKEKADEVGYLVGTAVTLGDKLGAILFQLPPFLHRNIELFVYVVRLSDEMGILRCGIRGEFRPQTACGCSCDA
jgi:uncharacterized protein YecE (DUF72 family)